MMRSGNGLVTNFVQAAGEGATGVALMFSNRLLPRSVPVRTHSTSAASSPRARKGAGHKLAIGAAIVAALAIAMPGTASATKVYPKVVPGKHFGAGGGAVVPIFACAGGI